MTSRALVKSDDLGSIMIPDILVSVDCSCWGGTHLVPLGKQFWFHFPLKYHC